MSMKQAKSVVKKTSEAVHHLNISNKERIRRIVEENETKQGRLFDISIQLLIIISIIAYSLETLPNLSSFWPLQNCRGFFIKTELRNL